MVLEKLVNRTLTAVEISIPLKVCKQTVEISFLYNNSMKHFFRLNIFFRRVILKIFYHSLCIIILKLYLKRLENSKLAVIIYIYTYSIYGVLIIIAVISFTII